MDKTKLKILIIGSGGREHAIGWKVAQSKRAGQIFFAPGNAGTMLIGTNVDIKANDINKLLSFAKRENIDLTIALPDEPLSLGVVNQFKKSGLRIWGPTKEAAMLESSKVFAKNFMTKYKLPTAEFRAFTNIDTAKNYLLRQRYPIVIKASGLALGKGVIIAQSKDEAHQALEDIMTKKIFGSAGDEIIIEDFLEGVEISIHAMCDGKNYIIFPCVQDHKRIFEGNTGPNTGGMGVVGPLPFVDDRIMAQIQKDIIAPTIEALLAENISYKGILYPSIMLTDGGPKIIEFNARFGDPEAQTYIRLLETDLLDMLDASIDGNLGELNYKWRQDSACTVVIASKGYPGGYESGKEILGIDAAEMSRDIIIFQAGTKVQDNKLVTNGGRVLGVSALGRNLDDAVKNAYSAVKKINFDGMQYREDIGREALLISN